MARAVKMDGVRKTVLLAAIWLAAAVGALAAASVGVSMVGSQVTGDRPAPLSAAEVREELQVAASSTTLAASPDPTTSAPSDTTDPSPTSTTTPAGGTATTVTTAAGPGASASSTTVTAAPSADGSEVRTYHLPGGTATLRFEPSGVTVVAATPEPGFFVDVEAEQVNGITGVKVEFDDDDDRRSRVTGWWDGGPRDEIREDD